MSRGSIRPHLAALLIAVILGGCGESDTVVEDVATVGGVLTIDYPLDESVFPPEFTTPTFLWHDTNPSANQWRIEVAFGDGEAPLEVVSDGPPPPEGEIDPDALGPTNSVYEGTDHQRSARSWTPEADLWSEIKRRSVESPSVVTIVGVVRSDPDTVLTRGTMRLTTSRDPVGAPVFYRDVPLMAHEGEDGVIAPLDPKGLPRIKWRLRDVANPGSKVLLTGVPSCANCHSFSADGNTMGMDVDGPLGDKGAYTMVPLAETTVIDGDHLITWSSFEDKPEGHRTIGFLSRISPDGTTAISTVNEALYVNNFTNYKFLQVFYPTRGILAWTSKETGEIKALPGADDTDYVHCNPVWFPDGKALVFARAKAGDPYPEGQPRATYAGDPDETPIRFDLYRMPFNDGKGGTPVPVEGASANGMSNTFPKISPDGKWIVYTKCKNGLLMRPDGRLWIVPSEGGVAREMRCNTPLMNSWHSFSPNGRWMVFSSKSNTPYTQLFLTHIDEDGNDTPAILLPNSTASNRASNIPEFLNRDYGGFDAIDIPAVDHHRNFAEGEKLFREGRLDEACTLFERALAKEPDFTRANSALGRALLELDRLPEAIKSLVYALELEPWSVDARINLGILNDREGKPEEARRFLLEALRLDPGSYLAHQNMGSLLLNQKKLADALPYFREAARLEPMDAHAHNDLGWVLWLKGDWRGAMVEYRAALENDPGHSLAQLNLLRALRAHGRPREVIALMESMVLTRPQEFALKLDLAWQLATRPEEALRNGSRAVDLAEECRKALGDGPQVLDVLAASYAEAKRFPEAVEAASRALDLSKQTSESPTPGLEDRLKAYRANRPYRQQ